MHFFIQTVNGRHPFDFCLALEQELLLYNQVQQPSNVHTYTFIEVWTEKTLLQEGIPVGSLDFVFDYIEGHYHLSRTYIHPINVPESLQSPVYAGRSIFTLSNKEIVEHSSKAEQIFIKSATTYKAFTEIVEPHSQIPNDIYQCSSVVEMIGEFRVFVMNRMIVDIRQYRGDLFMMASKNSIESMISAYKDAPSSYALDVFVDDKGETYVVEVHPFVSCGLYGMIKPSYLPFMLSQGFHWMVRDAKQKAREKEELS